MANRKRIKKPLVDENDDDDIEDMNMDAVTDSEEEYTEAERKLLEKARRRRTSENFDSDDEVYGLQDGSEDEEERNDQQDSMESDIEELQKDFDMPDERAWGKKKRTFFSTDYVDPDYASASQKDLVNAEIEEQEAKNIQKRLAEQLDDADFGLEFIQAVEDSKDDHVEDNEQIIKTDLSKLSKRQKQALIQKESPEFMALVMDFKECMTEVKDILVPFLKLVENGTCPDCDAVIFVRTKYHLLLNYCVNICFYLMLKAKRLPVNSHPVIKRLAQYRQLLGQLQSGQGNLLEEIAEIMKAIQDSKPLYSISDGSKIQTKKKTLNITSLNKRSTRQKESTTVQEEQEKLLLDCMSKEFMDEELSIEEEHDDTYVKDEVSDNTLDARNEDKGKRAITYQIAKNRGLTPYRKKELRNPRVKHRNKYRKAKIRRKGAVREVRKELTRYSGEISGIKASVKKGIKFK